MPPLGFQDGRFDMCLTELVAVFHFSLQRGSNPGGLSRFLFWLPQERNRLKYPPVAKILSRILFRQTLPFGSVSRYWPALYLDELTTHSAGLNWNWNDATVRSCRIKS